jgi:hypothetical protein
MPIFYPKALRNAAALRESALPTPTRPNVQSFLAQLLRIGLLCTGLVIADAWPVQAQAGDAFALNPCYDTYPTQLWRGARAVVDWTPSLPNIVRSSPGRRLDNAIGRIAVGEALTVLDGPRCVEGWVWWYVQADSGILGWTSEGEAHEYWLQPLPNHPPPAPPCLAEYPTRLRIGVDAWLSDHEPNSVRTQPTIYAPRLSYIFPGEAMAIQLGPVCADGWIWWYVTATAGGQGWTSEGGFGEYWLTEIARDR